MNPVEFGHAVLISRVAAGQWHALEDDLVVGRGDVSRRSDGRMFVSIDAWHEAAFDRLADAMLADLPRPLRTVVDEADAELTARWRRVGFTTRRREWEYTVPTDPSVTGLGSVPLPHGLTIKAFGTAEVEPLRALDHAIRAEVGRRQDMPAEVPVRHNSGRGPEPAEAPARVDAGHWPDVPARPALDPSKYAVAAEEGRYVGLLRVATVTRLPRIGLVAVRADRQRRGIARALLAHTLGVLHRVGKNAAGAEVAESNVAATALFEGIGARRTGSNLELVIR